MWFLASYDEKYKKFGNTNIRYLVDNGVTFWSDWPYKHYIENPNNDTITQKEFEEKIKTDDRFALLYGDLGPVYGKQWLNFGSKRESLSIHEGSDVVKGIYPISKHGYKNNGTNQIQEVIELLKTDPDSRRMLVTAWNPIDVKYSMLPPCHMLLQFWSYEMSYAERYDEYRKWMKEVNYDETGMGFETAMEHYNFPTRKLSMKMYIRSQDFYLGSPYNVAEYSILLHMMAQVVNMVPDELVYTMGDAHLYSNSIEASKEIISRESFDAPKLKLNRKINNIQDFRYKDIEIIGYKSHKNIHVPVAV